MWKLLFVALLVAVAQAETKEQRSSSGSYAAADPYQQNSYYPTASEYDGYDNSKPQGLGFFNTNIDSLINLGLNVLILLLIGFIAFTVSASVGSVIESADERGFSLKGLDVIDGIERMQRLYDSFVATKA